MIPKEIKELRKKLGWTQTELAEALGVTRNTITRYEMGVMAIREPVARLIQSIVKQKRAKGGRKR